MTMTAAPPSLSSTVLGLLLTTDLNEGHRVSLLLADDDTRLDLPHLSTALTLGDGDTDNEVCAIETYPSARLIVGRLAHPGGRHLNRVGAQLLDRHLPATADRWWLDLRGAVVITGMCVCGNPCDLPDHLYDAARAVSDSIPRK